MKKKFLKYLPIMAVALSLGFTACSDDDDSSTSTTENAKYLYAAQSEGNFYLTTFGAIPETGSITSNFNNAKSAISGHLWVEEHGGYIYANSGALGDGNGGEQTLHKYSVNEDGSLSEVKSLTFSNAPSVIEILFASETKAYAVSYKTGKLIIFNPATMEETGSSIDLSSLASEGTVWGDQSGTIVPSDGNPDPGNGIIIDGKIFLPLNQFNGGMMNYQPLNINGQIAIIDVATDKVEKVINTPDVQIIGMLGHTTPIAFGDYIYFATGPFASMMGMANGFVRVNKNTEEFDPSFHIAYKDLNGGETGSYCMQMSGADGKLYFFLYKESLKTNEDPNDYVNNKVNVPYELDVNTKTGKIIALPASSSWSAQATLVKDDYVMFGIHATEGSGFYRYYPSTGKMDTKPCVITPAGAYKIINLD